MNTFKELFTEKLKLSKETKFNYPGMSKTYFDKKTLQSTWLEIYNKGIDDVDTFKLHSGKIRGSEKYAILIMAPSYSNDYWEKTYSNEDDMNKDLEKLYDEIPQEELKKMKFLLRQ